MSRGFSLIEVLVMSAIVATFSVALILNFRSSPKSGVARNQVASIIVSDIRRAQSLATSGARFQGNIVCGYGVHYVNQNSYLIYAKSVPSPSSCSSISNYNYQIGNPIIETKYISNSNMEMRSAFLDVFYEPPNPRVYINNNSAINGSPTSIYIQLKGQQNCSTAPCAQISIFPSGQINLTN
ncbi:MAG: type II secretion system protein [Patescibacteria group bacterium]